MRRSTPLRLAAPAALVRRAGSRAPRTPRRRCAALLNAQVEAWNRGDLEGFMAGYWRSPELVFCSGATLLKGWDATLERYRKRYQAEGREMGQLRFESLEVLMLGPDGAAARGEYWLRTKDGQRAARPLHAGAAAAGRRLAHRPRPHLCGGVRWPASRARRASRSAGEGAARSAGARSAAAGKASRRTGGRRHAGDARLRALLVVAVPRAPRAARGRLPVLPQGHPAQPQVAAPVPRVRAGLQRPRLVGHRVALARGPHRT